MKDKNKKKTHPNLTNMNINNNINNINIGRIILQNQKKNHAQELKYFH